MSTTPITQSELGDPVTDSSCAQGMRWPLGLSVSIFLLAIVAYLVTFPLPCDDHWWHIATGRVILDSGSIPSHDVFSFTFDGAPWVNWEWFAGVLMALAWEGGGPLGMVLLRFLALGGALVLTLRHRAFRGEQGSRHLLLLYCLLAILVLQARTADRPHTLAFPLLALTDFLAARWVSGPRLRPGIGLVLVFLVWVNLHPSFLLGLAVVFVQVADELVSAAREARFRDRLLALGPFSLALLLVPLATPNVHRFFVAVREIFAERVSHEWGSFLEYIAPGHLSLLAFAVLALIFLAQAWSRPRLETFLILAIGVMAMQHVRFTPIFVLLALPRLGLPAQPRLPPRLAKLLTVVMLLAGLAAVQWVMRSMGNGLGVGVDPHRNPITAADFMAERGLGGRVYCSSKEAHGYLTFRLWPEVRVFIDGRVPQVYPADFLELYIATGDPQKLGAEIDRWRIDHVVLVKGLGSRVNRVQATYLRERGDFDLLFFDADHAVWSRRSVWSATCESCRAFEALDPWALTGTSPEEAEKRFGAAALISELAYLEQIAPESSLTRTLASEFASIIVE